MPTITYHGNFLLLFILMVSGMFTLSSCDSSAEISSYTAHYKSDSSFVLLADSIAPDGSKKYFEYCFDHGVFGYSRVFWSVINSKDTNADLSEGLLPDGYKTVGWTNNRELIVEKWTPYYYKSDSVELKSGMQFNGTKIVVK